MGRKPGNEARGIADQLSLISWIDKLEHDQDLKEATLKHPLSPLAAEHMAGRWLVALQEADASELFTIAFWFLEQISKDPARDLGLLQCFTHIFAHHTTSMMSVGKELYKKVLAMSPLNSAHLECLWKLTTAFPSLDSETAGAFLSRLLKQSSPSDIQAARAMTAVFRRAVAVEKTVAKKTMNKILVLSELTIAHLRLIGSIILCGCEEGSGAVASLSKWLQRTAEHPAILLGFQQVIHRLPSEPTVMALSKITVNHDTMSSAVALCKQLEQLICLDSIKVFKAWAALVRSHPHLHYTNVPNICELATRHSTDGGLEHLGTILSVSIANSRDRHVLLGRLFASVKTAKLLHPESFEAHLYLLDATLEAITTVDPLIYPFGLINEIHDWAKGIHCNALLPSLTRLEPAVFNADLLESLTVEERIDVLYSLAHHDIAFNYKPWLDIKFDGLTPHHLDRLAYLLLKKAPELGKIDLAFQFLATGCTEQEAILKLFTALAPSTDPTLLLSRLALLPKKARNSGLFLQVISAAVRSINEHELEDDSRRFILDAVQVHLIPFYPLQEYHHILSEVMQALCGVGGEPFRAALTRSLIQQSVDYALPVATRCAYIHILGHVADGLGAAGVLLSIAKDLDHPRAQEVAAQSLSHLLMGSSMPATLAESLGDLLWGLACDGRAEGLPSLLLAYAHAVAPEAVEGQVSVQILTVALGHALDSVKLFGPPKDTAALLETCTHILLTRHSCPSLPFLLYLLSSALVQGHIDGSVECLRWIVEFCPDEHGNVANSLLPVLLPLDIPRAEPTISALLKNASPSVLFDYACPAALVRYITCMAPSSDLGARGFQKCMELVSSQDYQTCKLGLELLYLLIAVLQTEAGEEKAILTAHQPHILAAFGLACHHEHPLARAQAYLTLSDLISQDFYGLGVAEHPRLDRLLTAAFPSTEEEDSDQYGEQNWPELTCQLARFVMVAAWSMVLRHPRLGTRFPLPAPLLFATEARAAIMAFDPTVNEYAVKGSQLFIGYDLASRCCISLLSAQALDSDEASVVRIALSRSAKESLVILTMLPVDTVPEPDIIGFISSNPSAITNEHLDLLAHLGNPQWATPFVLSQSKDLADDTLAGRVIEYLALHPDYDMFIFCNLLSKDLPLRSVLLRLKSYLALLSDVDRFNALFGYLHYWTEDDSTLPSSLQIIAFALACKPANIPASSPVIKRTVHLFSAHLKSPTLADCLTLILCKGQDRELQRVLAVKVLPQLSLSDSKREMIMAALQDLL